MRQLTSASYNDLTSLLPFDTVSDDNIKILVRFCFKGKACSKKFRLKLKVLQQSDIEKQQRSTKCSVQECTVINLSDLEHVLSKANAFNHAVLGK
jgi:hypothetical protein